MKKHGFISTLKIFAFLLLLFAALIGGFYLGSTAMAAYREQVLKEDAALLDQSLRMYAQTREIPAYPSDLHEISVARKNNRRVLTRVLQILRHGDYDESAEIKSRFRYTPILDAEKHYTMYRLEVTLPNGQNYFSPGSTRQGG